MPESFEDARKRMLSTTKEQVKKAYSSEEYALINAINAYLDTNKSYNLLYERLAEWFSIYFPDIQLGTAKSLAEVTILITSGEYTFEQVLAVINDNFKAKRVYELSKDPLIRDMGEGEKQAILGFAQMSKTMDATLTGLDSYIKTTSTKLLPNATYLTDEKIAAEMLSKAGSLERLATMPASTIQLLGAEKALFKHIKFGSKPPKYGILFKMSVVNAAPREIRGKIARAYATKISIALKADYFTKNFIAPQLKKTLEETLEKIRSAPRKPPQQRPRQEFRSEGGRGRFQGRPGFQKGNRPDKRPHH
jgi:nucleolar protein 56